MTTERDWHCLALGPIVEMLMSVHDHPDGWTCTTKHRHPGGKYSDCETETFEQLHDEELSEVLAAVSWSWSARSLHF